MQIFDDRIYKRQSNIELLRIVCMLMILILHSFSTPPNLQTVNMQTFADYYIESFCICAVNMFVITSGYFSIKQNRKSIVRLLSQIYFYAVVIYVFFLIVGISSSNKVNWWIILNAIPDCWWFISTYFVLYLISPLLNKYVENVSRQNLRNMLIAYFTAFFYYTLNSVNETMGFNNVLLFIGLYLIGRYIKLYYNHRLNSWQTVALYVSITLCIAVYAILCKMYINDGTSHFFIKGGVYSNPLVITQSIIGFLFFANIKIKSAFINYISISALAVYLIHMHPAVKDYYYDYCHSLYSLSSFEHYCKLAVLIFSVFTFSIVVDKVRILLTNYLSQFFKR